MDVTKTITYVYTKPEIWTEASGYCQSHRWKSLDSFRVIILVTKSSMLLMIPQPLPTSSSCPGSIDLSTRQPRLTMAKESNLMTFFDFPREIRDEIYRQYFSTIHPMNAFEQAISTYPTRCQRSNIFHISKRLRGEAEDFDLRCQPVPSGLFSGSHARDGVPYSTS